MNYKVFSGFSLLPIRLALGWVFIGHGGQKLFGLWGGPGLHGFAGMLGSMGITPALPMALLSAGGEFFGGLLILLGLYARFGAVMILIDMVVAIATVHWRHGFFLQNQGYEYNVALIAMCLSILFAGSGKWSVKQD